MDETRSPIRNAATNNFSIGDIVKIVGPGTGNYKDQIGEVVSDSKDVYTSYRIQLHDRTIRVFRGDLELVS